MKTRSFNTRLRQLAAVCGLQTSYYGADHTLKTASDESLLAVMKALGIIVVDGDIEGCLRERRQEQQRKIIEPVDVLWDDNKRIPITIPATMADKKASVYLSLESGEMFEWRFKPSDLSPVVTPHADGRESLTLSFPIRFDVPHGYHRLDIEIGGHKANSLVICAPDKTYQPLSQGRDWGLFIPLYAMRSERNWGAGDFSDLAQLVRWTGGLGGKIVGSLPMLASFLDKPCEVSPYLPASKLFWNDFYIDIAQVPELEHYPDALEILRSANFQKEIAELRQKPHVDYHSLMALKKTIISKISSWFFRDGDMARRQNFHQFAESYPELDSYACFRAAMDKSGKTWRDWPEKQKQGMLTSEDYLDDDRLYYQYAQWLAHGQLKTAVEQTKRNDDCLYLDLPLGVHPEAFDTWRYRKEFTTGLSAGAPPDLVFTCGQDWSFPPLHPENIREQGYRYVIEYVRHHMSHAGMLRIDHIMGFHRLYVIPKGLDSSQGVYLRYQPEEMYAIVSLESHRNRCRVFGEDLGIVPSYVRQAMNRHGVERMYILHYEMAEGNDPLLRPVPASTVASVNTHDMPPFAAFWSGKDIDDRLKTGIITDSMAESEKASRVTLKERLISFLQAKGFLTSTPDERSVFRACLSYLAASRSKTLLVNLEDLWAEVNAHNIPSTYLEYPNWRLKARYDFETFSKMPEVSKLLEMVNNLRGSRA